MIDAQHIFNKAVQLHTDGLIEDAIEQYKMVINLVPDAGMVYSNLGVLLQSMNRYDDALDVYYSGIQNVQDFAELYYNYGVLLQQLERDNEALVCYNRTIELDNQYIKAYNNRGVLLHKYEQYDDAITNFNIVLSMDSTFENAYFNRGNSYSEQRLWDLALADYNIAIDLAPSFIDAYFNKGNVLRELKQYEEAYELFEFVTEYRPTFDEAHWNKAHVKIIQEDYETGFKYYEYRFEYHRVKSAVPKFIQPKWLGQFPIYGKTILIYAEQGIGDSIQFIRYIPMVLQLGANVILNINEELVDVILEHEKVTVIKATDPLPDFDCHIPLMSLALVFKTTINTIPVNIPYLMVDNDKKQYWKNKLGPKTKPRIGLVWSGGFRADRPDTWKVNARRNVRLALLSGLKDIDAEFYSLQKGQDSIAQLHDLKNNNWNGPDIIDYSYEFNNFADTGALIEQLDLIIAVDTSTAHLAAALGKPVWLFNRYDGCWRWHHNRTDSPWYPTITIFNQQIEGEWEPVIQEVVAKLKTMW